jgi:uncharacterized protein YndB with AHSA1/START domain
MPATTKPIVREIEIDATPETVFEFFTDPEKLTRWLAVEATIDPRPGGVNHQTHVADDGTRHLLRGEFVEVEPPSRVVFTWGFEGGEFAPPGSSTVEVTLEPSGDGTALRLVHSGLPAESIDDHSAGWTTMLDRLAQAATAPTSAEATR